jgi:hypothetical protein
MAGFKDESSEIDILFWITGIVDGGIPGPDQDYSQRNTGCCGIPALVSGFLVSGFLY